MRFLVLSLNPALDVEWRVDALRVEEKNSILAETRWAGGKGVNVARWLHFLGSRPQLLVPLGGENGRELAQCLRRERLPASVMRMHAPTRANVLITAPDGCQMRFNQAGPRFSPREAGRVWEVVERDLKRDCEGRARLSQRAAAGALADGALGQTRPTSLLILSGSLPRGMPAMTYARLIRVARRCGVKTLLDCDGNAFAAAVAAHPFLVKPNEHELAQWRGKPLRTEAAVVRAARGLSEATRGWVLVSRGAEAGLLVNVAEQVCLRARPPRVTPRSRLGAGDALLAGAARQIELGASPESWLRHGLATGAAATQSVVGSLPKPALLAKLLDQVC